MYYHKSGKLDNQGTYRNGKREGHWVGYYDNGTPNKFLTATYRNGLDDRFRTNKDLVPWNGPRVEYHENGLLKCEGIFKDGFWDGPLVSYYDNGNLDSKGTYKDGKRDGTWVAFNKDGTVYSNFTGTFKNGAKTSN